jgi:hypothetical protein
MMSVILSLLHILFGVCLCVTIVVLACAGATFVRGFWQGWREESRTQAQKVVAPEQAGGYSITIHQDGENWKIKSSRPPSPEIVLLGVVNHVCALAQTYHVDPGILLDGVREYINSPTQIFMRSCRA